PPASPLGSVCLSLTSRVRTFVCALTSEFLSSPLISVSTDLLVTTLPVLDFPFEELPKIVFLFLPSDMMAIGCDLNGAHYENGEAFQPSPLYKCSCIGGAIGCTPVFIQKPAGLLGPVPLMGNRPAGLRSAYRDPPLAWKKNCLIQTTPWSPCSKTCGLGISTRVNNDNSKCEMRKDRRLCLLRPCQKSVLRSAPKGKTCCPKFQAKKAEKLTLSGCTSTKKFKPMYCGVCTDKRCCVPNKSSMIKVDFTCKGGSKTQWKMQWITSCVCQRKCNDPAVNGKYR
uniref:CCN family member 3 n=1 Tax=Kryptolebias marmoratus TaxID=37003 RepID=A0A3Q3ATU5_KRYMA